MTIDGRIIKDVAGRYLVAAGDQVYDCGVRGIFRKRKISPMTGDLVSIDTNENCINEIKPRLNRLKRPRVANVDQVAIVFAAHEPEIDLRLCDKLLILAELEGIKPVIVINKADLGLDCMEHVRDYICLGYELYTVSTLKDGRKSDFHVGGEGALGLNELGKALSGKVSAFSGPSGVGKSSIVNRLAAYTKMDTGELSRKIARGKNTTRHTELIPLMGQGFVIDTPGFTQLGIEDILANVRSRDVAQYFREFEPFAGECRFDDCMHISEPDCAVRTNIGIGISERRYNHYVDIYNLIRDGE